MVENSRLTVREEPRDVLMFSRVLVLWRTLHTDRMYGKCVSDLALFRDWKSAAD